MSITRLAIPGLPITPGSVRVPPSVARHAHVTRVSPGEAIELLNLDGAVGVGRVSRWEGGSCWVEVERVELGRGEPPAPLVLGLGVLHTRAFDWAVEKATEIGATAVVPVLCERVQGVPHAARAGRWQRVAAAAVTQCGRSRPPAILQPRELADFVQESRGVRLVAQVGAPMPGPILAGADGLVLLVGPEGGFTDEEGALIATAGFTPLPLGPRTLRAETAAVVALTLVQSLAGWLR